MAGSGQLRSREPAALRASRMQTGTRNLYQQAMCGRLQTETAAAFVADLPSETSKARMPSGALRPGFLQRRILRIIPRNSGSQQLIEALNRMIGGCR